MKGPYERLKYDLRRLWECPVCKRRERTPGTVTFRHCAGGTKAEGGQPVVMQLIGDGAQRLVPVIAAARGECGSAESVPALIPEPAASEEAQHPGSSDSAAIGGDAAPSEG
jgi:hypothetical protein